MPSAAYCSRAAVHDHREGRERLDVVDDRRHAPQAGLGGERRPRPRHAAPPFQARDQRRLLAADERAGALLDGEVEREAAAEDVLAQQAEAPHGRDRRPQAADRQRVLGADVDEPLLRADRVRRDQHPLEDGVRITLDERAVHEGARVALVCVADEESPRAVRVAAGPPLPPGGEAGPAAAAQAGDPDEVDHVIGRQGEAALEREVAVARQVVIHDLGVDDPAVAQHETSLRRQHRVVGEAGDGGRTPGAVSARLLPARGVLALLGLASAEVAVERTEQVALGRLAGQQCVERLHDQLGRHVRVAQPRTPRQLDVEQRLEVAGADAADGDDARLDAAVAQVGAHGVEHVAGAGGQAAGAEAHVHHGLLARVQGPPAPPGEAAAALKRARRGHRGPPAA